MPQAQWLSANIHFDFISVNIPWLSLSLRRIVSPSSPKHFSQSLIITVLYTISILSVVLWNKYIFAKKSVTQTPRAFRNAAINMGACQNCDKIRVWDRLKYENYHESLSRGDKIVVWKNNLGVAITNSAIWPVTLLYFQNISSCCCISGAWGI